MEHWQAEPGFPATREEGPWWLGQHGCGVALLVPDVMLRLEAPPPHQGPAHSIPAVWDALF